MSSSSSSPASGALIASAGTAGVAIIGAPAAAVGIAVVAVGVGIAAGIYALCNRK